MLTNLLYALLAWVGAFWIIFSTPASRSNFCRRGNFSSVKQVNHFWPFFRILNWPFFIGDFLALIILTRG